MRQNIKLFIHRNTRHAVLLAVATVLGSGVVLSTYGYGLDSDGDNIPDQWETLHGLDPAVVDSALDPDGDGVSSYDEYVADTDPWNAESLPEFSMGFWSNAPVRLFFAEMSVDRVYAVDYCDDLVSGGWLPLKENIPGNPTTGLTEDEDLTVSSRSYRMRVGFPSLYVVPKSVGFGPVTSGQTSVVQTVYLTNTGSTNQTLGAIVKQGTNPDAFVLSSLPSNNYVLAAGETVLFDVAFAPVTNGALNGELELQFGSTNLYVGLSGATTYDYYVNAGGTNYTGPSNTWVEDVGYFNIGGPYSTNIAIAGTELDPLYQSERFSDLAGFGQELTYHFPVVPGSYEVVLHFAEIFSGVDAAGLRVFDVEVEGSTVLTNFDIYAQAGFATALVTNLVTEVSDYSLDIEFITNIDNPKVSAIEVHSLTE